MLTFEFVVERITLTDVSKYPGVERFGSHEVGFPFVTVTTNWPGEIEIEDTGNPLENLQRAFVVLYQEVVRKAGAEIGKEMVLEIRTERDLVEDL